MQKINVFILAAGLGTRLQPISHYIPKPLLPIMGRPLLHHVLEKVTKLPFERIGINLHYKKQLLEDWIVQSPYSEILTLFPEEKILNTGGALRNAFSFLSNNPFLVHNVDILSNIDLHKLIDFHNYSDNIATLAVHDYNKFNKLILDDKSYLKELIRGENHNNFTHQKIRAFTGIAIYNPQIVEMISGEAPSVVTAWFEAIRRGYKIGTVDFTGCFWSDLGTPESYFMTVMEQLKQHHQFCFIHPSAHIQGNVHIREMVSIETDCIVHEGATLKNCILLPGTRVNNNQVIENCIYGQSVNIQINSHEKKEKEPSLKDDVRLFLSQSLKGHFNEKDLSLIKRGGSDRSFYRVRNGKASYVLMVCQKNEHDFSRYLEIARCLKSIGVPVAETYEADLENKYALIEDLGFITLYDKLKYVKDESYKIELYRQVIDIALLIHTQALSQDNDYPTLNERIFDYDHARWETSYFSKRFVKALCGIKLEDNVSVQNELHRLAIQINHYEKTLVHRDFQSQNIVIGFDNSLHIVDFQGARLGPPAYDLVSVLWDPYVELDNEIRNNLVEYYIERMILIKKDRFDEKNFRESLITARLQRHMQALGAYGFLSLVKGKKSFSTFIPPALNLLREDVLQCKDTYPALYDTVMSLKPNF